MIEEFDVDVVAFNVYEFIKKVKLENSGRLNVFHAYEALRGTFLALELADNDQIGYRIDEKDAMLYIESPKFFVGLKFELGVGFEISNVRPFYKEDNDEYVFLN